MRFVPCTLALVLCAACAETDPAPGGAAVPPDWVVGDAAAAGFDADALERLAAEIEAGDFPNTHNFTETEWRVAENAIHHSPWHPSHLLLPVVAGEGAEGEEQP